MRRPDPMFGVALFLVAAVGVAVAGDEKKGLSDDELSIYPGSVFEVPVPAPVVEISNEPWEEPPPPRTLPGFPPVVSHAAGDFLPITRESNVCVDCHGIEEMEEGDPTPIPADHYTTAGEGEDRRLAAPRHFCLACHVTQTEAPPLIGNTLASPPGSETSEAESAPGT